MNRLDGTIEIDTIKDMMSILEPVVSPQFIKNLDELTF